MKRLEATHFIEIWKGTYILNQGDITPIEYLQISLNATKEVGEGHCKTIAVWKIRYK